MKIAGAALERQQVGQWVRLAGFAGAGFMAAGCCLDGRAPLAAGLLAACRPGRDALSALLGGWDGPVKALLFFMAFDLFSGFAAACKKGAADSRVMLWGGVGKVMVLALVLGISASQYLLYVLAGWLFAQAVYFTVKMM